MHSQLAYLWKPFSPLKEFALSRRELWNDWQIHDDWANLVIHHGRFRILFGFILKSTSWTPSARHWNNESTSWRNPVPGCATVFDPRFHNKRSSADINGQKSYDCTAWYYDWSIHCKTIHDSYKICSHINAFIFPLKVKNENLVTFLTECVSYSALIKLISN